MEYMAIKNWGKFQYYKYRRPPWIKLHTSLLNNRDFCQLNMAHRGLLMQLWVLASENDGTIKMDVEELKFRLRDETLSQKQLDELISAGFLYPCMQPHADASLSSPETETETETETEERISPKHPAIQSFRDAVHRYPTKSWFEEIAEAIGEDDIDIKRWHQLCYEWVGRGWNPGNVQGMLEAFKAGGIKSGQRKSNVEEFDEIVEELQNDENT